MLPKYKVSQSKFSGYISDMSEVRAKIGYYFSPLCTKGSSNERPFTCHSIVLAETESILVSMDSLLQWPYNITDSSTCWCNLLN